MTKKIFGLMLIVILAAIAIVNIAQDVKAKKEDAITDSLSQGNEMLIDAASVGIAIGDKPPDFELMTLEGNTIKLSDNKGKKVILNFWASWCGPCKAEMPHLENYYKTKAKEQNVEIIAVNLTSNEYGINKLKKIETFIKDYSLTFPIPVDEEGDVGNTYQVFTIPTTYLINSNGLIENKIIGPMDEEMIEQLVKEMD